MNPLNPMRIIEEILGLTAVLSKDRVDILFGDIMNVISHHQAGLPGNAPAPTSPAPKK